MDVSYRQIKAFVEVAKSSTFAEAAVNLHLTQPALSSAIKKMEEQLGGKLFQRNTRNVSLTPEGEVLFPNALRLLHDWDNTFSDIQNLFAMAKGQLTICAMPSFAESHLPNILSVFHQRIPNVNLRIVDVVMVRIRHFPITNSGLSITPILIHPITGIMACPISSCGRPQSATGIYLMVCCFLIDSPVRVIR